ncbi:MAG: hypothetical protein AAGF94_16560 [Pseudomonadota bacterium]
MKSQSKSSPFGAFLRSNQQAFSDFMDTVNASTTTVSKPEETPADPVGLIQDYLKEHGQAAPGHLLSTVSSASGTSRSVLLEALKEMESYDIVEKINDDNGDPVFQLK